MDNPATRHGPTVLELVVFGLCLFIAIRGSFWLIANSAQEAKPSQPVHEATQPPEKQQSTLQDKMLHRMMPLQSTSPK